MASHTLNYHPHWYHGEVESLRQKIERRALERYLDRVHHHRAGTPQDDWLEAEAEVCAEYGVVPHRHGPQAGADATHPHP